MYVTGGVFGTLGDFGDGRSREEYGKEYDSSCDGDDQWASSSRRSGICRRRAVWVGSYWHGNTRETTPRVSDRIALT